MDKQRKERIAQNEVSEIYTFDLGGFPQKVLVEGKHRNLPVVVFLHGGPGTPIPFSVGCRGLFPEFTNKSIMVYWDQLGCGINNYKIDDTFTIEHFVNMTADLLREIKTLFPDNPLYIFATSWGSILSARVLEKAGNLVNGVVVCGQIIKEVFFSSETFQTLKASDIPEKKLQKISNIDMNAIKPKDLQLISSCIRKYTNGYENKTGTQAPMGDIIWGLLTSPDYKFRDFKALMVNGYQHNTSLWGEILRLDLTGILTSVKIPYLMLQGDTDIVASTSTANHLAQISGNPNLNCRIISNTGHLPGADMMNAVFDALTEQASKQPSCGQNDPCPQDFSLPFSAKLC